MKQTIYEQSLTPNYPVGKRIYEGDRVFRYCRALVALPVEKQGACNGDRLHENNNVEIAALAGDTTVTVLHTTATLDEFKDGYINFWTAIVQVCLRIKSNTASDGTRCVLTLKDPLLYNVPASPAAQSFCDMHANPYNNVGDMSAGLNHSSVICVPLIRITAGYYFWGQVWGPIIGIAHAGNGIGLNANERIVYFAADGSIGLIGDGGITDDFQLAGFMLATTLAGSGGGVPGAAGDDIFYMLQLSP